MSESRVCMDEPYALASLLSLMYEPGYVGEQKIERERERVRKERAHRQALNESQRPLSTVAFYLLHFLLCLLNGSSPFEPRFLLSFLFLSGSPSPAFSSSIAGGGGAQGRIKRSRHPSRNRPTTHPRGPANGIRGRSGVKILCRVRKALDSTSLAALNRSPRERCLAISPDSLL